MKQKEQECIKEYENIIIDLEILNNRKILYEDYLNSIGVDLE